MPPPTKTPFRKVLIANRGEIALRIMRTAKSLGLGTVAVYSSADAQSGHVAAADEAVLIGEPLPAQSYLRIDALIAAAKRTGADAVHPGYGFLAENAEFAAACAVAGLVFIGPSAASITAMGNKAGAKRLMEKSGVPCIPGYQGEDQSEPRLAKEAERIGYPLMIKAAAGGGGRGMRLVAKPQEFAGLLTAAKSEAERAFGSGEVILERAIEAPRHVEVQVFGDRAGTIIHLGERDCSVQRRHQKLIEEAPSPAVTPELRRKMGAAAVSAAKAIAYEGAGTIEFLLDGQGRFYFMEMNTRLQVEHPVTEAITGLDLVALQFAVAAGQPLGLAQEDVTFDGHAIEVRLCAEDAAKSFLPQSGTMALWRTPGGVRTEHAMASGAVVPPYYDSMIAKIIAHGATRDAARTRLIAALGELTALGIVTNQAFLARCLAHPVFAAGGATTAFIAEHGRELTAADPARDARAAAIAALVLYATGSEPAIAARGRRLAHTLPIAFKLGHAKTEQVVLVTRGEPDRFSIEAGGKTFDVSLGDTGCDEVGYGIDGAHARAVFARSGADLHLRVEGQPYRFADLTRAPAKVERDAGGDGRLRASMSGRVVTVHAKAGDTVERGQPLITLEAMKMQHVHPAPSSGRVTGVHVAAGDQVGTGRVMVEIAAA